MRSTLTINLTIDHPSVVTVTDNLDGSLASSAADSYQWINCSTGNPIVGSTSQTFIASQNGSYAVIGTTGSCSDTSDCVTINNVGLIENDLWSFSIAPNPSMDNVTILFDGMFANVNILDAQGKLVHSQQINSGETISIEQLSIGIYTFELQTETKSGRKRVMKN